MLENRLISLGGRLVEEPWQVYYLRKKQKAEQSLRRFIAQINVSDLTHNAYAAVEHGILHTNGKRVRPVLTYLIHDLVGGDNPYIDDLAILAELPHRGSLLEDDLDDNAKQRDGKPPTFSLFGKGATMEACAFLYNSPRLILSSLPIDNTQRQGMINEYIRLAKRARKGQEKDVQWGINDYIPSVEEYLQMCEEKCAAFEYAIRVGTEFGGATKKQTEILVTAGNQAATAFQLIDDLISLREGSDDFGSDISEGKKTLPVIHATFNYDSAKLISILSQHSDDHNLIKEAVLILNDSGGIKETENVARKLTDNAISLITDIFPDSKFKRILFSIINYGINRNE